MKRRLKVRVDPKACVGNTMCQAIAKHTFRSNDKRQSEVVSVDRDTVETILEAAESCPGSAIFVEDADTGEQLFP